MIELATLRTTSSLNGVHNGNINNVWVAPIEAESGQYNAYIKLIDPHTIFLESICAIAGREIGLDIPKPFIVQANHPDIADHEVLLFGCEDTGFDSFKQFVTAGDKAVEQALITWCGLHDAIIFDEWIANQDRNTGNFLYNGDGTFTLIDHERSLGGGFWDTQEVKHSTANELAKIPDFLGDLEKHKLRQKAVTVMPTYQALNKENICGEIKFDTLIEQFKREEVLEFLIQNSANLSALINARTGGNRALI